MSTVQLILLCALPVAVVLLAVARAAIRTARAKREAGPSDDSEARPCEEATNARR